MKEKAAVTERPPEFGLFVTCLVDLFRPSVGFAAVKLLEDAGCIVEAPVSQTCCGQPGYNSAIGRTAAEMAMQVIDLFVPTTSSWRRLVPVPACCASTIPTLFAEGTPERSERRCSRPLL